MDYEDDDFQSESFPLAAEGSIGFSPGLHSFPLPKFDLDDNLQVHSRFDSLVESEGLLGIHSQEENQWVGDFSRESSGLEFSSSAAESCSISRCNNVWSEATSSESVDLLLKSVGQDDMVMGKTIVEESDVCEGMDSLTNQMKQNSSLDGLAVSQTQNPVNVDITLPPDKYFTSFSALGKEALNQGPHCDAAFLSVQGVKSGTWGSRDPSPCSVGEKCTTEVSEVNPSTTEICNQKKLQEEGHLVDSSERNERLDGSIICESMQVDPSDASLHSSAAKFGNLIIQNVPLQPSELGKDCSGKLEDNQILMKDSQMKSQSCERDAVETVSGYVDNPSTLAPKEDSGVQMVEVGHETACTVVHSSDMGSVAAETVSNQMAMSQTEQTKHGLSNLEYFGKEGNLLKEDGKELATGTSISNTQPSSLKEHTASHDQSIRDMGSVAAETVSNQMAMSQTEQTKHGLSNLEYFGKEGNLLKEDGKELATGTSISNTQPSSLKEQTASHDQSIRDMGSVVAETVSNQMAMSQTEQNKHGLSNLEYFGKEGNLLKEDGKELATGTSISNTQPSSLKEQTTSHDQSIRSSIAHVEDYSSSVVACSSTNIVHESPRTESMKDSADGSSIHNVDFAVEAIPPIQTESMQKHVPDLTETGPNDVHISYNNVSALGKENENKSLPTDAVVVDKKANTDGLGFHGVDIAKEVHISSHVHIESMTMICQQNLTVTEITDLHVNHPDVSAMERASEKNRLHTDSVNVETVSDESFMMDKGTSDDFRINNGDSGAEARISSPVRPFMKEDDADLIETMQLDVHASDISDLEKETVSITLPTGSANVKSETDGPSLSDKRASTNDLGAQKCDMDVMESGPSDVHITHPDVSSLRIENAKTKLSTDSFHVEGEFGCSVITDKEDNSAAVSGHEPVAHIAKSAGVVSEVIDIAPDNNFHHLPFKCVIAKDPVIESEEGGESSLPDSVLLEKKEETLTKIPMEQCFSLGNESPRMSIESEPNHKSEKGSACDIAGPKIVGQSLSSGFVAKTCQDEPLSPVTSRSVQQYSKEEACPVVNEFLPKEKEGSEEYQKYEGASTSLPGVTLSGCECSQTVAEGDAEVHSIEVGSSGPSSYEPNCGSPTIISSCEASQSGKEYQEGGTGSLDQAAFLSDDIGLEAHKIIPSSVDSKENDTPGDDKSFTFKVGPRGTLSEKESAGGWKPFPSIQPFGTPQTSGNEDVSQSSKDVEGSIRGMSGKVDGEASGGGSLEDKFPQHKINVQGGGGRSLEKNDNLPNSIQKLETGVQPTLRNCKGSPAEVDRRFPFQVLPADLDGSGTCNTLKPFSSVQPCEFPQIVEVSSSTTSSLRHVDSAMIHNLRESPQTSAVKNARRSPKGNTQDKTRPLSGKVVHKENIKEGTIFKELIPVELAKERGSKSLSTSPNPSEVLSPLVQAEGRSCVGYSQGGSIKSSPVASVQTSYLLNTSAAFFQQPFTDFQQVQLRAQIFVYGSLIQGTAPDEACMVAAFGESGCGRNLWENVWRVAVEKLQRDKSPPSKPGIPSHLLSGARLLDHGARQSTHQREADCTPNRVGIKGTASSTSMPPSSPLWTVSTPLRDGLPLSSNPMGPLTDFHKPLLPSQQLESPHARQTVGHTTPWLSQPPSGTWLFTPQSAAANAHAQSPAFSISESVHVTPARESAGSFPLVMQRVPPSPLINTGSSLSGPEATTSLSEAKRKAMSPSKQVLSETKSRKRKKSMAPEESGQMPSLIQSPMKPVSAIAQSSTAFHVTTPITSASKVVSSSLISSSLPVSSTNYQVNGVQGTEPRAVFSEDMCSRTELAKRQAEDAALHAASATRHSQTLWNQLTNQKGSGVASDIEAKLACLAVAVAAAASVAKAASAAAKVASDAALQAKLMADEALVTSKSGDLTTTRDFIQDSVNTTGTVTSASILKGIDRAKDPDLVLVAAREAARKRVETASAAAKRAENLDAVLKAAQIAADAVSQVGTIIAMGDPLPLTLSELVNAGPEGYWKIKQTSSEQHIQSNSINKLDIPEESLDKNAKRETKWPPDQGTVLSFNSKEFSKDVMESQILSANSMQWASVPTSWKEPATPKDSKTSDPAKTTGVVPGSQIGLTNSSFPAQNEGYKSSQLARTSKENTIKEGSLVEVLSKTEALRKVWVSAKVLSLKDEEAYVSYESRSNQGQLMEWVPLGGEGGKAPRIRIAHPMSSLNSEGTKKRRRAARGDYTWSVGDKVDAWTQNGWREGVITEKNKEDETNLTVCFSDQGDSSVVKAWHLRPSLIWEDGQWMECCRSLEINLYSYEGETPQGKPTKKSRHESAIDPADKNIGKDTISNSLVMEEERKHEGSNPLPLSSKEKVFTLGKNMKGSVRADAGRTKRTGLQKEGPGVIFGVPKPGKTRKFMDVSKHYGGERSNKATVGNESSKFPVADYLIPQDSTSRGWKTASKNVFKGKSVGEFKSKVISSGKTQRVAGRIVPEKDDSSSVSDKHGAVQDNLSNAKSYSRHDGNISLKPIQQASDNPNCSITAEGAALYSSLDVASDPLSSKKKSSSAVAAEPKGKGKIPASGAKFKKDVDHSYTPGPGQSVPNSVERRRSNRRIQPTSRLLEGIQSSLTISKIPTVSHEKNSKSQQRSSSSKG